MLSEMTGFCQIVGDLKPLPGKFCKSSRFQAGWMEGEPDTHGVAADLEMGKFTPSPEQIQPKVYVTPFFQLFVIFKKR